MELVEILYRIMYKNMPSVLLGGSLGGLTGRTPLGQPDPETRTGRTTPKILTRKPGSDGQQPPRAGPTLSETKSRLEDDVQLQAVLSVTSQDSAGMPKLTQESQSISAERSCSLV